MFFEGIIDDVAIYNRALTEKRFELIWEEEFYRLQYNPLKNWQPRGEV